MSSSSTASNSNPNTTGPLTLHVVESQTSAENGRKFTKYKVSVNYNGREWEIWRRFKEFNTLNDKVGNSHFFSFLFSHRLHIISIFSFVVLVLI
jgi:hypothetical protein